MSLRDPEWRRRVRVILRGGGGEGGEGVEGGDEVRGGVGCSKSAFRFENEQEGLQDGCLTWRLASRFRGVGMRTGGDVSAAGDMDRVECLIGSNGCFRVGKLISECDAEEDVVDARDDEEDVCEGREGGVIGIRVV